MNSKEIVLKALNLQKTPRLPVSLLSGGAWTFNRKGFTLEKALALGAEQAAEIIAETNELVKSDIVWPGSGYHNLAIRAIGGKIKFRAKGTPDIQEVLLTEAGDVDTIKLEGLQEDAEINVLVETARVLSKTIGEWTLVGASQWGPFTLAGHVYGVERLMRNIYKDRQAVHAVLEFTSELCFRYLELFVDAGAEIISIADPTASGDMISRGQFQEFALPYLKRVVERVEAKGVAVSIHICGNISDRLDLIPSTGAKNISLDYKVDLEKAREQVGDKMAFSGNMDPVAVMQDASPAGVRAACIECLRKAGPNSSYILMPGCDIPPAVPLENICAMVETAWNFNSERLPDTD
ncbi:uroporphyrinogen decarboxylase family protein [Bacillota bacterium LX-D]|nr:uroporphyrinogen decarboxylase family protein [Bacillota bacterium LX-D]